jgi:hypothetical protein
MKPAEILVMHRARIQQLHTETGSWAKVYDSLPEMAGMSLATFKQYAPILLELNKQLNNIERLNNELNNNVELKTVKQELEQVKQELNRLKELNTELNNQLELNITVKQETVKQGLNIAGWNVQESGGYFRAFKKVAGKMKAVYLGKTLEDAEKKIQAKQKQLQGKVES